MFDTIHFFTTSTATALTSSNVTKSVLANPKYDATNLINSRFAISGSVEAFPKPLISDFAKKNFFYMQDFCIFNYGKNSFTERQNFPSYLILYTYAGSGQLSYKNKTYSLRTGDGFFINCTDWHMYKTVNSSWKTAILHIDGPLLPHLHESYLKNGNVVFHEEPDQQLQKYMESLLLLYTQTIVQRDWRVSVCLSNLLNHLLLLNTSETIEENGTPKRIRQVISYIDKNYSDPITLDFLADSVNLNKYYFSKEFKRYTGFSPNDYLIYTRINQAKTLLHVTTLPAIKIAHSVGIHDINNFTKLFKKRTGLTPIQFRKANVPFY